LQALALLAAALLPAACGDLHDRVQDIVHGWSACQPVSERCFSDPKEFYSMPTIAALETWRGRDMSELIASWGRPDSVESLDGGRYRYVWVERKTIPGEVSYQHDQWKNDWDLVRSPDQNFECRTFMETDGSGKITPMWVDRLGACAQYFSPRLPAPPVRASGAPAAAPSPPREAPAAAPSPPGGPSAAEEPPVPLEPPRQIREQEGL
jgi:hypothetical protein